MERARKILKTGGYTCVLHKNGTICTAAARGVKPLVPWLTEGLDVRGFSAADKVAGRATAYLYVLLRVEEVCPFEEAVPAIHTPEKALTAIRAKMAQMNISL